MIRKSNRLLFLSKYFKLRNLKDKFINKQNFYSSSNYVKKKKSKKLDQLKIDKSSGPIRSFIRNRRIQKQLDKNNAINHRYEMSDFDKLFDNPYITILNKTDSNLEPLNFSLESTFKTDPDQLFKACPFLLEAEFKPQLLNNENLNTFYNHSTFLNIPKKKSKSRKSPLKDKKSSSLKDKKSSSLIDQKSSPLKKRKSLSLIDQKSSSPKDKKSSSPKKRKSLSLIDENPSSLKDEKSPKLITSDQKPSNLTVSDQKSSNLITSDQQPSNLTISDQKSSNLTVSDQQPSNLTVSDQKPSNLTVSIYQPSNLTVSDQKPSNLTVSIYQPPIKKCQLDSNSQNTTSTKVPLSQQSTSKTESFQSQIKDIDNKFSEEELKYLNLAIDEDPSFSSFDLPDVSLIYKILCFPELQKAYKKSKSLDNLNKESSINENLNKELSINENLNKELSINENLKSDSSTNENLESDLSIKTFNKLIAPNVNEFCGRCLKEININLTMKKALKCQFDKLNMVELIDENLTVQHLMTCRPVFVKNSINLEFKLPENLTINYLNRKLGDNFLINTFRSNNDTIERMELRKFIDLFRNNHLINCINLDLRKTVLDNEFEVPNVIKELKTMYNEKTEYSKNLMILKRESYIDFHYSFSNSLEWFYLMNGILYVLLIEPTINNVEIYKEWIFNENRNKIDLLDQLETDCYKYILKDDNCLFIPKFWLYAIFSLDDSLIFSGDVYSTNFKSHLIDCNDDEDKKFNFLNLISRFPFFKFDKYVQRM